MQSYKWEQSEDRSISLGQVKHTWTEKVAVGKVIIWTIVLCFLHFSLHELSFISATILVKFEEYYNKFRKFRSFRLCSKIGIHLWNILHNFLFPCPSFFTFLSEEHSFIFMNGILPIYFVGLQNLNGISKLEAMKDFIPRVCYSSVLIVLNTSIYLRLMKIQLRTLNAVMYFNSPHNLEL